MSRNRLIALLVLAALIILSFTVGLVEVWNLILLQPMLNFLILLSSGLFSSFGLAIIVLVIIVRLLMLPITLRQLHSTKAMSALQPKLAEVQKKYGKDRAKLQQEMARVYKESGVSPLGCLWPMLIQLPIWIALYQSILRALAATPEDLLGLSKNLYPLAAVHQAVPLSEGFLWLNLGQPDKFFILAILVGASMWVLQKMSTVPSADPKQQSMSNMMLWMMPLMFAFLTLSFPSGLALFWLVSNIIGIITQYFVTGWGSLSKKAPAPAPQLAEGPSEEEAPEEGAEQGEGAEAEGAKQSGRVEHGKSRDKRKDRRGGRRASSKRTRRK